MPTADHPNLDSAETALQNAILHGDVAVLDMLLDSQVVFVGPDGSEVRKAADLESHRSGNIRLSELTELSRSTRQFDNSGITRVTLHLIGTVNGAPLDAQLIYTRSWCFDGDRWRVIQAQGAIVV